VRGAHLVAAQLMRIREPREALQRFLFVAAKSASMKHRM
jgi:hypothetical protein